MPTTYFIADLHLSAERTDIIGCFHTFLKNTAVQADALYILGDLFEVWLGDDDITPFTLDIAAALNELHKSGTKLYFIHGNRDFMMRNRFAKSAGMELLPEAVVIDLYGKPTLIMHGDTLCTKDYEYQAFRKKSRGWWWPRLVRALPLSTRRNIAAKGRVKSKANQENLTEEIMDVTPEEVILQMQKYKVKQLIHGHTHRPAIHEIVVEDSPAKRIVLGDWYEQGSVLKATPEGIELQQLSF